MPMPTVNKFSRSRSNQTLMDNVHAMDITQVSNQATIAIKQVPIIETRYVEIFLLYPTSVNQKSFNIKHFFHSQLNDIDLRLAGQSVFLSQEIAAQYNRFTGNHHCILRVYVEDTAIEGCNQGLILRRGFISRQNVYECMIMTGHGMQRWLNPEFNESCRELCLL